MVTPPPATGGGKPRGRVVVVGSLDFATDRFVRTAPENLAFTLNAIDWLAQDEELIAIRSKDRRPPPLLFAEPGDAGRREVRQPGRAARCWSAWSA